MKKPPEPSGTTARTVLLTEGGTYGCVIVGVQPEVGLITAAPAPSVPAPAIEPPT